MKKVINFEGERHELHGVIKVFQMNDYDWYLAETAEEAFAQYNADCGPLDKEENQPRELSQEELSKTIFTYETGVKMPFAVRLKCMIERGDINPQLFATIEV